MQKELNCIIQKNTRKRYPTLRKVIRLILPNLKKHRLDAIIPDIGLQVAGISLEMMKKQLKYFLLNMLFDQLIDV